MANIDIRTLPPYAEVVAVDKVVTKDNIGGNFIGWPYLFGTTFDSGIISDYSATGCWGLPNAVMLTQYESCGWMRTFYPMPVRTWEPAQGLSGKSMAGLLKLLDFWHAKGIQVLWVCQLFRNDITELWTGYLQDSAAGEQAQVDCIKAFFEGYPSTSTNSISTGSKVFTIQTNRLISTTVNYVKVFDATNENNFVWGNVTAYNTVTGALTVNVTNTGGSGSGLTSWVVKFCSPTGYTLAEHPGLGAVQIANEQIETYTSATVYARTCRIVTKLFELYKPACKVITLGSSIGKTSTHRVEIGSAASLIPLATNGDLGTGKQGCDYGYGKSVNFYTFNADTVVRHEEAILTNEICSRYNKQQTVAHTQGSYQVMTKYNPASNKFGGTIEDKAFWGTENSKVGTVGPPARSVSAHIAAGYWVFFMANAEERYNNLVRWYLPTIFSTSDGAGGLGVSFLYGFGNSGGLSGTSGAIASASVAAHTGGQVKLTLSNPTTVPFSSTVRDMSIVITAGAGGWADLGLAAGERNRFIMKQVSGSTVYLADTVFTGAPAASATYREYQEDWAPAPEELKQLVDLLLLGPVTFGWVHYPNMQYPGVFFSVQGVGTWYTTETGQVKQW